MKLQPWTRLSIFVLTLYAGSSFAFQLSEPVTTPVAITKSTGALNQPTRKNVTVLKVHLTEKEMGQLQNSLSNARNHSVTSAENTRGALPTRINLGMNSVPVFDQGAHGTCVTFANTAAIDALMGKGDYVSQLCSLELGQYLKAKSDMPSGWDGSYGPWISDQILRFGIINKSNQLSQSCAGVTQYPVNAPSNEGKPMSLEQYQKMSEPLNEHIYFSTLLNSMERASQFANIAQGQVVLQNVKAELAQGNRVPFGTLLIETPYCSAGACAKYHAQDDTWALTEEIQNPSTDDVAGHEMLIIGYDDNAVAIDHEGNKHKGLLILRNSWGDEVGDQGNYYMTYDYFALFVSEAQMIGAVQAQ